MMDTAMSRFSATLKSVSLAAVSGDRIFTYALLFPCVILLLLLDWNYQLFIFLGLAYASALLGFMIARMLGAFAQKVAAERQISPELQKSLAEQAALRQTNRQLTMELAMKRAQPTAAISSMQQVQAMIASHELKEPLRTMQSFIQLLHDRHLKQLDREGQDFLHFISDGAQRMQDMIDHVQTCSGVSQTVNVTPQMDLNFVAADVLRFMGTRLREAKAIVQIDELPCLGVDPQQFGQLLQNLIENGLKYNQSAVPKIYLSCEQKSDYWLFRLVDNGIGIEAPFQKDVFDLFRRLHGVGTYSGSGIGLAVCKKIVDNHGGKIWIESAGEAQGTTVCFSLSSQ